MQGEGGLVSEIILIGLAHRALSGYVPDLGEPTLRKISVVNFTIFTRKLG